MIEVKQVIEMLKMFKICVSRGDYDSVKELSSIKIDQLETKWNEKQEEFKKIKQKQQELENKNLENFQKEELIQLIKEFYNYIKPLEKI